MTKNVATPTPGDSGEFILYQTEDGRTRIDVRVEYETVWLAQRDMAELFQTSVPNINQHLATIYDEGELSREATIKHYLIVRAEGNREVSRKVEHYNLDVIISVGWLGQWHTKPRCENFVFEWPYRPNYCDVVLNSNGLNDTYR